MQEIEITLRARVIERKDGTTLVRIFNGFGNPEVRVDDAAILQQRASE